MVYVLLQEQSRVFAVAEQFGFLQSFLKIQFYNYLLLSKVVSLTNVVVIWEQLQTHPLITFIYLDFLFSFLESNKCRVFFTCTVPSITGHRYLSCTIGQPPRSGFINSMNSKGWGALFILRVTLSYQDYHWAESPARHSLPALQRQDLTDLKYQSSTDIHEWQRRYSSFTVLRLLFLPSSPELRKCFMNAKVRRKLKDVIHMCISNDCDCIMPCILYSLISLPSRGKNPHPVVSNPLRVITP